MMDFLSLVAAQFHIAHFLPVEAIIRSQKRDYLDLIPRGGNGLAQDFRAWFFKIARKFDGSGEGSQLPTVRSFLTKFSHRENNAFLTAQVLAQDGLEYWEGYAFHATLPVEVAIHHAWNRRGTTLLDITWTKSKESQNLYFGVPVARDVLTRLQIELAVDRTPYAGPVAFLAWALQGWSGGGDALLAKSSSALLRNGR